MYKSRSADGALCERWNTKIVKQCSLPLTGKGVVHRIITDLGVMDIDAAGMKLIELAKEVTLEQIQAVTGVQLNVQLENDAA